MLQKPFYYVYSVLSRCCIGQSHFCAQMRLCEVSKRLLKVPLLLDVGRRRLGTGEDEEAHPRRSSSARNFCSKRQEAALQARRHERRRRVSATSFTPTLPLAHAHTRASLQRSFIIGLFPLRGRDRADAGR